jgi:hypothetical protein
MSGDAATRVPLGHGELFTMALARAAIQHVKPKRRISRGPDGGQSCSLEGITMTRSKAAKLPDGMGELDGPLTDADRVALASTALSILRLPYMLQQFSNACDMLEILAGKPCWRAGYILGQSHYVLNAYSGFRPHGHKEVDWRKHEKTRAEVDKLVEEALAKRRELIAEQEAFRASDERKALIARLESKGFKVA